LANFEFWPFVNFVVGILSAIAIPNYQKFTARARQAEAKIQDKNRNPATLR
jgi:Tfp pilus assembly major pilin PilA